MMIVGHLEVLMSGPCAWTIPEPLCCPCWEGTDPRIRELANTWASEILWALSGRRYGECQLTVRPCEPCHARSYVTYPVYMDSPWGGGGGMWLPYINDGAWYNCACGTNCCCEPGCRVALSGPATSVISVMVDGVLVPDTDYRIVDKMWLVRKPGTGCWPNCQHLGQPNDSSDNTFVVEYVRGDPVPGAGLIAASLLQCEIAKRCQAGNCSVPFNITSMTREGVTVEVGDTTTVGKTGIKLVDDWVNAVNPGGLIERPRVWNADLPDPEMTTWSA